MVPNPLCLFNPAFLFAENRADKAACAVYKVFRFCSVFSLPLKLGNCINPAAALNEDSCIFLKLQNRPADGFVRTGCTCA